MLLALLLHFVIFHPLTARDAPPRKDTEYKIKHIDTCPHEGYYFQQETTQNSTEPGACYVCFCQGENTAVCGKTDNKRCSKESFHHHGVGKRDTGIRRNLNFADIIFRDGSRHYFNKKYKKAQCKPFQSRFSDNCPPADWCTGCTVCDCDTNGQWDCHILRFCLDEKDKKKTKRKGSSGFMRKVIRKPAKPNNFSNTKSIKKTRPSPVKNNKPTNVPSIKRIGNNKDPRKHIVKKSVPLKQGMTPEPRKRITSVRYKRISPGKSDPTNKVIIKKKLANHNPLEIKSTKVNIEMAQKLMAKVMANLRKSVTAEAMDKSKIARENATNKKNIKNGKKYGSKPNPIKENKIQIEKSNKRQFQKKPKKVVVEPVKKPIYIHKEKTIKKSTQKPTTRIYVRNKRDISMTGDIGTPIITQGNSIESANITMALSIIPITSNLLVPYSDNAPTPAGSSTLPADEYYKYIVSIEEPKVKIDGPVKNTGTTQGKLTETVFNLMGTQLTTIVPTEKALPYYINNNEANKLMNVTEINPETNDLKYSKLSNLKIMKEKKNKSDKHISLVKLLIPANKTITLEDTKYKVHSKNVNRKLNFRKYNIVKLLNHAKHNVTRYGNDNSSNIQIPAKTIGDLQRFLRNVLRGINKNSTTLSPNRKRKFSVLRYLKRIFNKIFKRENSPDRFSKHHVTETLCEYFGPCKVSRKDKLLLNRKLAELDSETKKILKTVKIIKGLLKLVELPKSSETDISTQVYMQNDIKKLNNILKGSYANNEHNALTATQLTQIEYIKKNTQDFIHSVSRFATLLNEIIAILTKDNSSNNNKLKKNLINKNFTKDPFQGLKHLLVKYNLIQNAFMKQMYEQLNNFENKTNGKVSADKDLNNSVAIENFSRNIIQNLRKLKRLAQTVSYNARSKRETARDDDPFEYLLMMMEYLIKQNHPLDAAPVNDGIDLLIDAIKNAPDIKPIKKKVLEYTPATYADYSITLSPTIVSSEDASNEGGSSSGREKSSSEENSRIKLEDTEGKLEKNKGLDEYVADDDKESEDKYYYDQRAVTEKTNETTEMAFFNKVEEIIIQESENLLKTTTSMPIEVFDKLDNQDEQNVENTLGIKHIKLDKFKGETEAGGKKIDVFVGDMDDEIILPGTNMETDTPITMPTDFFNQANNTRAKMRPPKLESYNSNGFDKKYKLEWIEENFGKENQRESKNFDDKNVTQAITETPKTTVAQRTDKIDDSSQSKETIDEITKNQKKAKINAEEIMLKKQMDLLNSLDYGTEKAEIYYGSDSKDINAEDKEEKEDKEDKYSSDGFPSYFV